jgi:hypothetical protein
MPKMNALGRFAIIIAITFASSMAGLLIQLALPAQTLTESRGAIGGIVGLITLLLALVLGLLVWASFGVFSTQISEAQTLGPAVLELDLALKRYGPEAAPGRAALKAATVRARERFFGEGHAKPIAFTFADSHNAMEATSSFFNSLTPTTDEQRELLTTAKQLRTSIVQTQLLMSRQLANPLPGILLVAVVCWSALLFLGHGLMANFNAVTVVTEALGAISVSSAIFLILEFSEPYSGVYKIKPRGIDEVISELGK